jgi:hypothetical protein
MKFSIIKLRIVLWSLLGLTVLWLLYMGIVPSGKITYVQDFSGDNYFIKKLTPAERMDAGTKTNSNIIGDPVYFSLRTPRRFNSANVEIKYKNNSELPIIETGVLMDKVVWRYAVMPIENKIIDGLAGKWSAIKSGETILLQREKKYNSVDEFLKSLPAREQIALYNYDLQSEFLLPNYQTSNKEMIISNSLRGPYQFYTYIKNENLDFNFSLVDLNANKDSDPVDINVYYNNQLISSKHLDDDGVVGEVNKISDEKNLELKLNNLPEGVYKIEVKTNDDIITKKIITKQSKLAFINSLRLADANKNDLVVYSDSNQISAQTINPAKLQTILIDGKNLDLKETYKQFDLVSASSSVKEIKLAKDDVMLSGDGVFSFSKEAILNPSFKKINYKTDLDSLGINYVLANYQSPKQSGDWKIARAKIDLSNAYREFNKYSFMIAIPGLKADDGINDNIEISEIKIDLEGTSLWEKIGKYLK